MRDAAADFSLHSWSGHFYKHTLQKKNMKQEIRKKMCIGMLSSFNISKIHSEDLLYNLYEKLNTPRVS